jgi:hypothetical protein
MATNINNTADVTAWRARHPSERLDLERANLREANLERANLERANLGGANLERANLGDTHIWMFSPVGSRGASLEIIESPRLHQWHTGCFWGNIDEFEEAVRETHGDNQWGRQYMGIIALVRQWMEMFQPAPAAKE